MIAITRRIALAALALTAAPAVAQTTNDPYPQPLNIRDDVVHVGFVEFASLPDVGGEPARPTILLDEPGTGRLFVNDMRGPIYTVGYEGGAVTRYIDINDPRWGVRVQSAGRERGFQSFAIHPQFGQAGTPGYGKFYTWTDSENTDPEPDYTPGGGSNTHDTVLLEWTARTPTASTYDGGAPRELLRIEQPFPNHNAGQIAFNPTAEPGDADFGQLYVGVADGGSGGDPLNLSQNPRSIFGKVIRIDPLATDGPNGEYGIPADNPFVRSGYLPEIWAIGVRNPQRFAWDPENGNLFLADIGQNIVEEVSIVTRGANLGWNAWEGSFAFVDRTGVRTSDPRSDSAMTYPVAEYSQQDPLFTGACCAVTGLHVYRDDAVPALEDLVLFGDNPSGELFYIHANRLPSGGQEGVRRILLMDDGEAKTLLQVIQEKNAEQGRQAANRVDLRYGSGRAGQVMLLNKQDGVIRLLTQP